MPAGGEGGGGYGNPGAEPSTKPIKYSHYIFLIGHSQIRDLNDRPLGNRNSYESLNQHVYGNSHRSQRI